MLSIGQNEKGGAALGADICWQPDNMAHARQNKIGCAIRSKRKALGLTLSEVAARAKTTQGAVSHIERGVRKPSAEMLARLASALDCSVDELLTGLVLEIKEGAYMSRIINAVKVFPPSIQKQVADYCDFLRHQTRMSSKKPSER